ncbi:D-aminoacyl-tRNA deacylase [Parasphaerochaeta coccoides]|uniref:D-aminoacyl-tRNA deacylase n=1 Tax=Parasphaerochaeta coccoides (strain ATCC BAA-1237 / DSM 17374 / SPN1) TaxID=760011 RepID=F4GK63_PARC1|nr:D-aminoacyl-tRNA deacylase [Parasphaerochaeta coccoides]AEC01835.1 D-tyrosyl-tRNA(Tyr) deacylase [Parasphaerochaeta coccoides DSM 17374]
MKCVIQRVKDARVVVDGETIGTIGMGLLVYVGFDVHDDGTDIPRMAGKLTRLRIFEDIEGKMNLSVKDVGGAILVVSQFTLVADLSKGNRPSWDFAASPDIARDFYERFLVACRGEGVIVQEGRFGAHMRVIYENDGPATFLMESARSTGRPTAKIT